MSARPLLDALKRRFVQRTMDNCVCCACRSIGIVSYPDTLCYLCYVEHYLSVITGVLPFEPAIVSDIKQEITHTENAAILKWLTFLLQKYDVLGKPRITI